MAVEKLRADWVGVVPNYTMGLWRSRQCFFYKKEKCWNYGIGWHLQKEDIEICKADRTTRHLKNPKLSAAVAVDSCFAIIVARQDGVTSGEILLKISRSLWFKPSHWTLAYTESRHITCFQEGKSQSVALMSRKEDIGRTKPTLRTCLDKPCKMYSISDL